MQNEGRGGRRLNGVDNERRGDDDTMRDTEESELVYAGLSATDSQAGAKRRVAENWQPNDASIT